jgi:hypothetical protein
LQIFGRFRKIIESQEGKFLQKFILMFAKIFLQGMKDSEDFFLCNQVIQNKFINDQFSGLCGIISLKIGVFLCHEKFKQ